MTRNVKYSALAQWRSIPWRIRLAVHGSAILVAGVVAVIAILLSVPAPLVAVVVYGSGYVTGNVMIRRIDRKLP